MTTGGGTKGNGCIYKVNPDGTGFNIIHSFTENTPWPIGRLTISDSVVYGGLWMGGTMRDGSIFKIKNDGSGYTTLVAFNDTNGLYCLGSPVLINNVLYGMTYSGDTVPRFDGIIFDINTDGSNYTDIVDFRPNNCGPPSGQLIFADSTLYGMVSSGGLHGNGVIFKYKPTIITKISESFLNNDSNISFYPNPAKDKISIKNLDEIKTNTIEIFDISGQVVLIQTIQKDNSVDVSNLVPGVYILKVSNASGVFVRKLIKE